jgi:hypothetical protein
MVKNKHSRREATITVSLLIQVISFSSLKILAAIILFIYSLFNDTVNSSENIASSDEIITEEVVSLWKEAVIQFEVITKRCRKANVIFLESLG